MTIDHAQKELGWSFSWVNDLVDNFVDFENLGCMQKSTLLSLYSTCCTSVQYGDLPLAKDKSA